MRLDSRSPIPNRLRATVFRESDKVSVGRGDFTAALLRLLTSLLLRSF